MTETEKHNLKGAALGAALLVTVIASIFVPELQDAALTLLGGPQVSAPEPAAQCAELLAQAQQICPMR